MNNLQHHRAGDTIMIEGNPYRINRAHTHGAFTLIPVTTRTCDTFGCNHQASDNGVQIAPGTTLRLCPDCAAELLPPELQHDDSQADTDLQKQLSTA